MIDESAILRDLAAAVALAAVRAGATICTAESCTGGMIAHLLTETPGVSAAFLGSVVAYSNAAKAEILGVSETILAAYGAVSDPVARAMARGACERFHATLGVSTTGIAGPGGGSAEKPVGLVYVALCGQDLERVIELRLDGDRSTIIREATREALQLLERALSTGTH